MNLLCPNSVLAPFAIAHHQSTSPSTPYTAVPSVSAKQSRTIYTFSRFPSSRAGLTSSKSPSTCSRHATSSQSNFPKDQLITTHSAEFDLLRNLKLGSGESDHEFLLRVTQNTNLHVTHPRRPNRTFDETASPFPDSLYFDGGREDLECDMGGGGDVASA